MALLACSSVIPSYELVKIKCATWESRITYSSSLITYLVSYFERTDLRYPQNADFWNKVEFRDFEKYLEMIFEEVLILLEESKK